MKTISMIFMSLLILTGCDSDIDKCVKSQVEVWKEHKDKYDKKLEEMAKANNGQVRLADAWDFINSSTEKEVEAQARIKCLKAASGKD
jgi:hypothetical protein